MENGNDGSSSLRTSASVKRRTFTHRSVSSLAVQNNVFSNDLAAMVQLNKQVLEENENLPEGETAVNLPSKIHRRRGKHHRPMKTSGYLSKMSLGDVTLDQHMQTLDELEARYQTNLKAGLSEEEALKRLQRRGPNEIVLPGKHSLAYRLGAFVISGMNLLYLCAIALLIFGYYASYSQTVSNVYLAIPLVLVMVIQTVAGFVRSRDPRKRSDHSAQLASLTKFAVTVIRSGTEVQVNASDLVSGDICILTAGDSVPADMRIVSDNISVEESVITGSTESLPKSFEIKSFFSKQNPFSATNLVFLSSTVVEGRAKALVLNCGNKTVVAKLASQLEQDYSYEFPLVRDLRYFYLSFTSLAIMLGILFLFIGIWITSTESAVSQLSTTTLQQFGDSLQAVALIILAVLPLHFQLVLVLALRKTQKILAQTGVHVSHLPVISSISSISTLAISAPPNDDVGSIQDRLKTIANLKKMGISVVVFFENQRTTMSGIFNDIMGLDGEDEGLVDGVDSMTIPNETEIIDKWLPQGRISAAGSVMVGGPPGNTIPPVASQTISLGTDRYSSADVQSMYIGNGGITGSIISIGSTVGGGAFVGLPVRVDNEGKAGAIATPFKSSELRKILKTDRRYIEFFALTFMQKLRVVLQLKAIENVRGTVGFFGGFSEEDAPCIRSSHVGIAMRKSGDESDMPTLSVCERVSDVTVDNLYSVVVAIKECRRFVNNFRKIMMFFMVSIVSRIFPAFLYFCAGYPLALTPVLLVATSLVVDLFPALAFVQDPIEYDVKKRRPRIERKERIVSGKMVAMSCFVFGLLGCFSGFLAFVQMFNDFGFTPSGLVGLSYATAVIFEKQADPTQPGFPSTKGVQLDLSFADYDDVHLCGRVGSNSGYSEEALQLVPENERCGGPLFTLKLFNLFCYSIRTPSLVTPGAVDDKISFFEEQKQAAGILFYRNVTSGGLPVCGVPDGDGVYLPYGFYTTTSQGKVDKAMKDQICNIDLSITGSDGNTVCFTNEGLPYAQTAYFSSAAFFTVLCALLIFRTEIYSFYQIGLGYTSYYLLGATLIATGVIAVLVYAPNVNESILGTRNIDPWSFLTPAMPFIVLAFAVDEVRKYLMRRPRSSSAKWLIKRTMW